MICVDGVWSLGTVDVGEAGTLDRLAAKPKAICFRTEAGLT